MYVNVFFVYIGIPKRKIGGMHITRVMVWNEVRFSPYAHHDDNLLTVSCSLEGNWPFRRAYCLHHCPDNRDCTHLWNISLFNETIWRYFPEGNHFHIHCHENLISHFMHVWFVYSFIHNFILVTVIECTFQCYVKYLPVYSTECARTCIQF